MVEDV
jgi:hypothetical protein